MLGQACVIILAFADNIMIGWHSVEELAASSFVNNVMNLFILAELGFASGMTPIVGSFHGTGIAPDDTSVLCSRGRFYGICFRIQCPEAVY